MKKKMWFYAPVLFCLPLAHAQNAIDFNVNFGSAFDSSSGSGIDNANSPTNPLGEVSGGGCVPNTAADPYCEKTPSLGGFFLGFGGDIMFKEHFGAGVEANFQPGHSSFGPFNYRQTFYDFNGIYEPIITKRVIVQLQAGIGGARTSFGFTPPASCVACSTGAEPVGSQGHFQIHLGAGVQFAVTEHIFLRPEFDVHYVPGLSNQPLGFGSDWVPEATIAVGYHFGSR